MAEQGPLRPSWARWREFAEDALKVTGRTPPWHRGVLALAGVLLAFAVGRSVHGRDATAVAPALAVFLTLADVEGPLRRRLSILLLTACGMLVAGSIVILSGAAWMVVAPVFLFLVALAGVASVIGPPYQQATRFTITVGLLLTVTPAVAWGEFALLLALVVALLALGRTLEHLFAPDAGAGDFASLKKARFALRAARGHWPQYVLAYVATAAAGYALGRGADAIHPTWLTITVVVVMWPDAQRSYQRIVQRIFGTLVGALVVLLLLSIVPDPRVLAAVAALMLYFLPIFIRRNYWLHTGLMVVFVLLSLRLFQGSRFTMHLVFERIGDVLMGCLLALLGTLAAFHPLHRRMAAKASTPL